MNAKWTWLPLLPTHAGTGLPSVTSRYTPQIRVVPLRHDSLITHSIIQGAVNAPDFRSPTYFVAQLQENTDTVIMSRDLLTLPRSD